MQGDVSMGTKKEKRHKMLKELLLSNPFLNDEQLALSLSVSVQTIRLDRVCLSIPELRERIRIMAENAETKLKAIASNDIVGDLIDLELGKSGISVMSVCKDMLSERSGIARGHYMFAQANTLALAVVDANVALTGLANIKYKDPIRLGDKLIAKARVTSRRGNKYFVSISIKNSRMEVFRAKFIIVSLD